MAYASSGQGNSPEFRRDWLAEFPEETAADLPADGDESIDSTRDDFTAKTSPGGDIFTWRPEPAPSTWPRESRCEGQDHGNSASPQIHVCEDGHDRAK